MAMTGMMLVEERSEGLFIAGRVRKSGIKFCLPLMCWTIKSYFENQVLRLRSCLSESNLFLKSKIRGKGIDGWWGGIQTFWFRIWPPKFLCRSHGSSFQSLWIVHLHEHRSGPRHLSVQGEWHSNSRHWHLSAECVGQLLESGVLEVIGLSLSAVWQLQFVLVPREDTVF